MNYEIDITRRCNFRCPGCNHLCNIASDASSDMTPEDIKSVVDQINANDRNPQMIAVVGGEPTMHPGFAAYCQYIKSHVRSFSKLRINTNFTNPDAVALAEALGYEVADYLGPRDPEAQRNAKLAVHYNSLLSPLEEGIPINDPRTCFVLRGLSGSGPCGICVHRYKGRLAWCYCPNATSIAKLLQREDEFMFPTLAELFRSSTDKLCRDVCVHCMSIARHHVLAKDTPGKVSECFRAGLEEFRRYGAAASPAPYRVHASAPMPKPEHRPESKALGRVMREKFDRIMCLSCPQSMESRLSAMLGVLSGMGLGDMVLPFLNEHNVFANAELERRRFANDGARKTNVENCLMGHYGMVKFALDAGFRNVLFMEDDCRFTIPVPDIAKYIANMPSGVNATVDYVGVKSDTHSTLFSGNESLWAPLPPGLFFDNLTCYMLNRDGMRCVVEYFERCGTDGYKWPVDAADRLWPHLTSSVPVYIPRVRFAVQNGGKSLINGVEV